MTLCPLPTRWSLSPPLSSRTSCPPSPPPRPSPGRPATSSPPTSKSSRDPSRPCLPEWPCERYLFPQSGAISRPDLCPACAERIHGLRGRIHQLRFPSPPPTPPLPPAAFSSAAPRLSRRLAGLAPLPPSSSAAPAPRGRRRRPCAAP